MLIIIIALIYYGNKYSKINKLKGKNFPYVDPLIFKKWKSYELESARLVLITGVIAAIWNISALFIRAANKSVASDTISPLLVFLPYLILFGGLVLSGIYGGRAKKLREQYRIKI